jgi:DeoR/GlpR family transcriptional regulator of sugar metabolism
MTTQDARSLAPTRHEAILRRLDETGNVVSADLAMRLGVSMDTVRRDLAELEAAGRLQRVHGGAVRPAPGPRRFEDRLAGDGDAKGVVAALAARLVEPGQAIVLGGGTSTLLLARALAPDLEATVVTTSPDVALALREHPGIDVDLLGGRLDRVSQTVVGADTVAQARALRPDLCLVGACSVDPEVGVTLREREEAHVVRALLDRSARRVLLVSRDKLGTAAPYVVAAIEDLDVLVTDAPLDDLAAYADRGVELVTP